MVRALEKRYGALDQEQQIYAVSELMTFQGQHGETTDETVARFDVISHRAAQVAGIAFPPAIRAWVILTHLRVPRQMWPIMLSPTLGMLPVTEDEYIALVAYLRRNAHMFESGQRDPARTLQHPYLMTEGQNEQQEPYSHYPTFLPYSTESAYTASESAFDDDVSWHSYSTGNSMPDEEVDWTEFPDDGEFAYLAYRDAKKRFRYYAPSRGRFKGRSKKGKGKGKGKGRFRHGKGKSSSHLSPASSFWLDGYQDYSQMYEPWEEDGQCYFKGRGKGGNPTGKDGVQMKCSVCSSTEHFWRDCKQKGKGKGKGGKTASFTANGSSAASSASTSHSNPAATQPHGRAMFFSVPTEPAPSPPKHSRITFMDGSPAVELSFWIGNSSSQTRTAITESSNAQSSQPANSSMLAIRDSISMFPWWQTDIKNPAGEDDRAVDCFHSNVRLPVGEALLIDTGAPKNMMGEKTALAIAKAAQTHGFGMSRHSLDRVLNIEGVGKASNACSEYAVLPIALEDGQVGHYKGVIVPDSLIPALLGTESLESRRSIIDTVHGTLIELGPGEYNMQLPPGSKVRQMRKAPTGHYMLPCTNWDVAKPSVGKTKTYVEM